MRLIFGAVAYKHLSIKSNLFVNLKFYNQMRVLSLQIKMY